MNLIDSNRHSTLQAEIRARIGSVPAFLRVGASMELAEHRWSQMKAAYLDSVIPPVFKEELCAYLSRFCDAPYCMARHAAFLQGVGFAPTDSPVPARAPEEVLRLLGHPVAGPEEFEGHLKTLASITDPIDAWPPDTRSIMGRAIFVCSVHVFLRLGLHRRSLVQLRRVLGLEKLERLIVLLDFVRAAHGWTEAQPQLPFDEEVEVLMREQPKLRSWIELYRPVVQAELRAVGGSEGFVSAIDPESAGSSAQYLGAVLEDSLNEIYVFDADTLRFTQANRGARQNLGYSLDELRQLTHLDLMPELSAQDFHDLISPLRSGESARVEFNSVHRRKDGSLYPVEVHLLLSSALGARVFVAMILDTTERRVQLDAIAELAARGQTILNAAADAIVAISDLGVIESINAATVRLFGYEESQLVGQNIRILMPTADAKKHDGYLARYRRTGKARIIGKGREVEGRRKDGSLFPIRLSIGEARFDDSRLFIGIIHDLSSQKKAEAERDESDKRLRALFHQGRSLTGICSRDGVLLDANKAALDFAGIGRDDVVGWPVWDTPWWRHDPALQEQLRCGIERAPVGGLVRFDGTHPRADGTLRVVDVSITPVTDLNGEIDVLLVESSDVTDTRNLQAQLLQLQKMEAMGTLAGGIAHDFNNLLTSIRGSSEVLVDHLEPDSRLARSAWRIQKAADRGSKLTSRLLGFSRKHVTERRSLDMNEAVDDTREIFGRTLLEDIELETNLSVEALYVRADESQVGQVLTNLVVNAGDAMPNGGHLLLATRREAVNGERADSLGVKLGDYVAVVVRDTGAGMSPETMRQIFDPFFTTKAVGEGTGLGLSTSLGIIREHGGAIEVESELGAGTSFTVLLPEISTSTVKTTPRVDPVEYAPASGETVLLVEDDEITRDLLSEILEEAGYVVVSAGEPDEALGHARAHEGRIDLVITDVILPNRSGFGLAKELRSQYPNIRVLYMSGYAEQVLANRGELIDDDLFLRKPFRNETLLQKVREILHSGPLHSN